MPVNEYLIHYSNDEDADTVPPEHAPKIPAAPDRVRRAGNPPPLPDRMAIRPPAPLIDTYYMVGMQAHALKHVSKAHDCPGVHN